MGEQETPRVAPTRWEYGSHTHNGNFHSLKTWLNENHPEWDVVAADFAGHYTVILYRVPDTRVPENKDW